MITFEHAGCDIIIASQYPTVVWLVCWALHFYICVFKFKKDLSFYENTQLKKKPVASWNPRTHSASPGFVPSRRQWEVRLLDQPACGITRGYSGMLTCHFVFLFPSCNSTNVTFKSLFALMWQPCVVSTCDNRLTLPIQDFKLEK